MKKSRIKTPALLIRTRDQAEFAFNELTLAITYQNGIIARRDAELLRINSYWEAHLGKTSEFITEHTTALHLWAAAHPEEFPKDRRSIDFPAGTLGFRTGNPKVEPLNRRWTWKKILAAIASIKAWTRTPEPEIDKESILKIHAAAAADPLACKIVETELALHGLKVTQAESFFVDPKLTPTQTRQTQEAK